MARDNTMRFSFSSITQSWSSVTLTSGGSVVTAVTPATAPPNGTAVTFPTITVTGLSANTPYYVINSSGSSFGLAVVPGGSALPLTGTTQSAATMNVLNLVPVSNALSTRTGFIKCSSPVNHWVQGYSDALNVGRFRDQQADQSQIATINSVVSAISGDQAVFGSTSDGNYYLRTAVNVAGIFGPSNCQIQVQGNVDSTLGVAPAQTDAGWSLVSGAGLVQANGIAGVATTTATSGAITVQSSLVTSGGYYIVPTATAGGLTIGTPLVVFGSKVYNFAGSLATTTAATNTSCLVANFNAPAVTITGTASSTTFTSSVPVNSGDIVIASTTAAGLTLDTAYFATVVNSTGGFTLASSIGGTPITGSTATVNGFKYNPVDIPYLTVSNTVTSNVFAPAVTSQPHGLSVGSIVVVSSGTISGGAVDTAYFVNSVPTPTTFTISATLNGATLAIASGSTAVFAVGRQSRIVNVQIAKTLRNYLRTALFCSNPGTLSQGYVTFLGAELSIGKDSAQVF